MNLREKIKKKTSNSNNALKIAKKTERSSRILDRNL